MPLLESDIKVGNRIVCRYPNHSRTGKSGIIRSTDDRRTENNRLTSRIYFYVTWDDGNPGAEYWNDVIHFDLIPTEDPIKTVACEKCGCHNSKDSKDCWYCSRK